MKDRDIIELFRQEAKANSHLVNWLVKDNIPTKYPSRIRPCEKEGREYIDFYRTFYNILQWYKIKKLLNFNPNQGWTADESIIPQVKKKYQKVLNHMLTLNQRQYDFFYSAYDLYALAFYTAIDYRFQNLTGSKINTIVDFGSGIGRQATAWMGKCDKFYSVDAVDSLYLIQYKIYELLYPKELVESFDNREVKSFGDKKEGSLYHLPTWRMDSIPPRSVDLIIAINVLQEIAKGTLEYTLSHFKRIVKKQGFLYIRDLEQHYAPSHKVNIGRELMKNGWRLIYRYLGREGYDMESIPRLWVYTGEDYSKEFNIARRIKRVFTPIKNFGLKV